MELCDYNVAKQWAELSNAAKTYSNGGKFSFAGNQCKLLLNNIDKLQEICEKKSFFTGLDYVDAFKKFQVVVNDCFSSELQKNYDKHIEEFKGSYEHLGISLVSWLFSTMLHNFVQGIKWAWDSFQNKPQNLRILTITNTLKISKFLRLVTSFFQKHGEQYAAIIVRICDIFVASFL